MVYDPDGLLVSETDATGVGTSQSFDPAALTVTAVGPDPRLSTTTYYDDRGRLHRIVKEFDDADGVH